MACIRRISSYRAVNTFCLYYKINGLIFLWDKHEGGNIFYGNNVEFLMLNQWYIKQPLRFKEFITYNLPFVETKRSAPYSQQPPLTLLFVVFHIVLFYLYHPIYTQVFQFVFFLHVFSPQPCKHFDLQTFWQQSCRHLIFRHSNNSSVDI